MRVNLEGPLLLEARAVPPTFGSAFCQLNSSLLSLKKNGVLSTDGRSNEVSRQSDESTGQLDLKDCGHLGI